MQPDRQASAEIHWTSENSKRAELRASRGHLVVEFKDIRPVESNAVSISVYIVRVVQRRYQTSYVTGSDILEPIIHNGRSVCGCPDRAKAGVNREIQELI